MFFSLGNPLYIIGYCTLMMERELGRRVALNKTQATEDAVTTARTSSAISAPKVPNDEIGPSYLESGDPKDPVPQRNIDGPTTGGRVGDGISHASEEGERAIADAKDPSTAGDREGEGTPKLPSFFGSATFRQVEEI